MKKKILLSVFGFLAILAIASCTQQQPQQCPPLTCDNSKLDEQLRTKETCENDIIEQIMINCQNPASQSLFELSDVCATRDASSCRAYVLQGANKKTEPIRIEENLRSCLSYWTRQQLVAC